MQIGFIEDTHLHGGTQLWVAEAVHAFIEDNHEISLIAPEGSWIVEACRLTKAVITTYDWDDVVHESQKNMNIWINALRNCDVVVCTVHPPRAGFHCSVFASRCIKEGGVKTHLISKTGTIVPEYQREFYLPDETIHSSIIAIADFTRRYLIEVYNIPAEKVALIYQGTDTERFSRSKRASIEAERRYPLPADASPILGSIGSFEPRKGHPVLFEALSELVKTALPDVHLMMVGDGPDETILKDMAKNLGLERNISFFPFTDEPNIIYERLDMTVLPSLNKEGLPNVLLESLSMGVPVVSSNIGGIPEIVVDGDTGFLVEPGNISALAEAIRKIWSNRDKYEEMQVSARNLILNQFDKRTQFERFISHFHNLSKAD